MKTVLNSIASHPCSSAASGGEKRKWGRGLLVQLAAGTFALLVVTSQACGQSASPVRTLESWTVAIPPDKDSASVSVAVPSSLEDALQLEYDGESVWETRLSSMEIPDHSRLLLRFEAVATHAVVRFQDQVVGEHLGGWTPFEIDLTDVAFQNRDKPEWTLKVDVDELVGHNTQGFLPIITSHFSGIWQPVTLRLVPNSRIERDQVLVRGDAINSRLSIQVPVVDHDQLPNQLRCRAAIRFWNENSRGLNDGESEWSDLGEIPLHVESNGAILSNQTLFFATFPIADVTAWTPKNPCLYEVRLSLSKVGESGQEALLDQAVFRCGFSSITADGEKLLLNGETLIVRGLLNWGYAPPRIAPAIDEDWIKNEIRLAQERGFNLMKFCLWIPPQRYLELCDEMGMLAWIEYPTWHPKLDEEHRNELVREYREFFYNDRNHPCVALRSLTCETGPSADLNVLKELYELGKTLIPGSLIEDDSSWIEWNRIHDFYDDHPYGNNHTWVATLDKLKSWMKDHGPKPLVLGEAIAADTWNTLDPWSGENDWLQSAHGPWSTESSKAWLESMSKLAKSHGLNLKQYELQADSLRYSMLMRKFQVETYRREVPFGGYVVSVIRDFPKAAMGLVDFANRTKHETTVWEFQRETMLLLHSPDDCRSFESGTVADIEFILAGAKRLRGMPETLNWSIVGDDGSILKSGKISLADMTVLNSGEDLKATVKFSMPETGDLPFRVRLQVAASVPHTSTKNEWPIWVFPKAEVSGQKIAVARPLAAETANELLESLPSYHPGQDRPEILIVDHLETHVLEYLDAGGKVLMLPNGTGGSFALQPQWFLRGGIALFRNPGDAFGQTSWTGSLVYLQHFDLASDVIPRVNPWIGWTRPEVLLWDNHDLRECRTHGLVFTMPVGQQGIMTVSALNHFGPNNAAGRWVLARLIADLQNLNRKKLANSVDGAEISSVFSANLSRRQIALADGDWKFCPDPGNSGHLEQWWARSSESAADRKWDSIRIGSHWESQGKESLDGWGWYQSTIRIPNDWPLKKAFLVFTGVDDYCDVYVNDQLVGSCGDLKNRVTAFDLHKAIDVGDHFKPGEEFTLTIAVNDWNGAGGLFRPIFLETSDPTNSIQLLNPLE